MEIIKSDYNKLFSPDVFSAQENKDILHFSDPNRNQALSIEAIWEKIEFNRLVVNNLSMSKDQVPIDNKEYSDGVFIKPSKVLELFEDGASIIIRGAHRYFKEISEMCADSSNLWRCETQANLYLSKKGVNATFPHFDPHELYIHQLYGEKDWSLYESKYLQPEYTDGYNIDRHGHGKKLTVLKMKAGDIAFLPRGTIHQPIAITDSVHIALGIKAISNSQLLALIINLLKENNIEFRKNAFQGNSHSDTTDNVHRLLSIIRELTDENLIEAIESKLNPRNGSYKCLSDVFNHQS